MWWQFLLYFRVCIFWIQNNPKFSVGILNSNIKHITLVRDPNMHHGTCVTHVPWCMSGWLTHSGGENVPGIPGTFATRNFTYLARGPLCAATAPVIYSISAGRKLDTIETHDIFKHPDRVTHICVSTPVASFSKEVNSRLAKRPLGV